MTFHYFDQAWNLIQLITAKEMQMKDKNWELSDGSVTLFAQESSFPLTQAFKQKTLAIQQDNMDLTKAANSSEVMSIADLKGFIKKNKEAGLDTMRYEVDYHAKFGFAFAGFVMSFLGVPFSVRASTRGGGRMISFGLALALVFLYWSIYSSSLTLGRHGGIPAIMAAWAPNLFMSALAAVFLLRSKR